MNFKNSILLLSIFLLGSQQLFSQINARMFRYPDVSDSHIVFSYADDIWVVAKEGGTANRLSSAKGEELFARFSPDGSKIAFNANYDGNSDIYVLPTSGGQLKRLTYHSGLDRMVDWHPSGDKILFSSSRESGRQRYNQFYSIDINGGAATKLAMPYGDFASYSPDGKKLAFNFKSRAFRTWKRYKGGWAPDLYIYDLENNTSENFTNNASSDEFPMWVGNKIYYLSDEGVDQRYNIWSYDPASRQSTQITQFNDTDVHFPSAGKSEIVFEAGGKLYLMNIATGNYKEVLIKVFTDQRTSTPHMVDANDNFNSYEVSPEGKRVVIVARGDVFSVPVEEGYTKNLTNTSGVAERYATWSPDGKNIAYWTDKNGEYQLALYNLASEKETIMTSYKDGFRYNIYWSPDSKKIAFVDQTMNINYFDIDSKKTITVDKGKYLFHGGLSSFEFDWSADSRYLTWHRSLDNQHSAIFIYDLDNKKKQQVTSGYYSDSNPVFDPEDKYLYFLTARNFSPNYSDQDGTFIYANSTQVAVIPLTKEEPSPLLPQNDEAVVQKEESKDSGTDKGKKKDDEKAADKKALKIDFDGIEERVVILPLDAGNYAALAATPGKLIYHKASNTGSGEYSAPLYFYDLKSRESQKIVDNANAFELSANGEKLALWSGGKIAIVDVKAGQKTDKVVDRSEMKMMLDPKAEWKQIFTDAWRLQRDFFYDKNMHGLDWEAVKKQYGAMVDDAATRRDVNFILGEMIGELNASHTYRGGGDTENPSNSNVGYLGIDWEMIDGKYRIKSILKGAKWDAEPKSPLSVPGINVKAGDYILTVNGIRIDGAMEPYAAFEGLAGKTVELTVSPTGKMSDSRKVIVQTMRSETRLRHLAWIEANRKRVDEATDGKVGYVYVRSTGLDGQNELVRQLMAQIDKQGLIIDERFNSGGQIPDRFVELLNRKTLAYFAVRDGKDWKWPNTAMDGPKAMLINGWSGSGGDAFPDYFRKSGLGPLIGNRTWGGLIGISGAPDLIDGGSVSVPTFRMYDPDGKWFKEGYGVDPDIEVKENPGELARGTDAQLERAIAYVLEELKNYKGEPEHEDYEKR